MHLRTITTAPPVTPRRMYGGNPVLEPDPSHSWESHVVLNPAAVYVPAGEELHTLCAALNLPERTVTYLQRAGGACIMLYRAQGDLDEVKKHAPSSLGLALFTPELELVWRFPEPVIRPEEPFHNLGVEDPRATHIHDTYYLYYTGYAAGIPGGPPETRKIQICLATTRNFLTWNLLGPVDGDLNTVPNKNAALFPEPVHGRWLLLHRPMDGPDAMAIHLAEADRPEGPWRSRGLLMESYTYREFARSWIGAGGPPIPLGGGRFLMIYHQGHFTEDGHREYDLAAALLDFNKREPVQARIEPLMRPTGRFEQQGDSKLGVDNVLFTCAGYVLRDHVIVPYAGADSRIFAARLHLPTLLNTLESMASG